MPSVSLSATVPSPFTVTLPDICQNAGKTEQGVSQRRVCLLSPAGNHARWSAGRPAERPAERRHGTTTFFHFAAAAHLVQRVGAAGQQGGLLKLAGAGHLDLRGKKEEQDGRRTT